MFGQLFGYFLMKHFGVLRLLLFSFVDMMEDCFVSVRKEKEKKKKKNSCFIMSTFSR